MEELPYRLTCSAGWREFGSDALAGLSIRQRALQMAASLEQYSKHPLAGSVLEAASLEAVELAQVSQISEKPGQGLSGTIGSDFVQITGRKSVSVAGGAAASQLPPATAGMECILLIGGEYAATFRFHDAPRKESSVFVGHLAPHHQVNKVMLVSGDREAEVRYLAAEVGINEVLYGKSPDEKVTIVREEAKKGPTLFLGDGINDAPGHAGGHSWRSIRPKQRHYSRSR